MKPILYKKKKFLSALLVFVLACSLAGCSSSYRQSDENGDYLNGTATYFDTYVNISMYEGGSDTLMDAVFNICRECNERLSRTSSDSEIYKLNDDSVSGEGPLKDHKVSVETAELIAKGLEYGELSDGAFDISIGAVSKLWDFKANEPALPDASLLAQKLELVDFKSVSVDGTKVSLGKKGMELDLGGIAKGYVADRIRDYLVSNGVTSALISLGGNILCVGSKRGVPFKIGIQKPFAEYSETVAVMEIEDKSVVSSGVYERSFEKDGVLYHHILDPKTGYPTDNGVIAVTVVGESSAECDALSTALSVKGLDEGMKLIDSIDGYFAVFITDDYELHYSKGFAENIKIL